MAAGAALALSFFPDSENSSRLSHSSLLASKPRRRLRVDVSTCLGVGVGGLHQAAGLGWAAQAKVEEDTDKNDDEDVT